MSALIQTPRPAADTADNASPHAAPLQRVPGRRSGPDLAASDGEDTGFYFWDDTAASFVPIWHRIGELVSEGVPALQIDMWRGGSLPAEAAAGIYNPLVLVLSAITSHINDLALAAWAFKVPFLVLLAIGVFLLAIDFGSDRRIALLVGYAAPFAGFTLWSEASTWVAGLMILSFYPWIWRAARRMVRGEGGILAFVIPGVLCLTVGNPYAVFTVATAVLGALIEGWIDGARKRCGCWWLRNRSAAGRDPRAPAIRDDLQRGLPRAGRHLQRRLPAPGSDRPGGLSNRCCSLHALLQFRLPDVSRRISGLVHRPTLAWVAWRGVPGLLRVRSSLVVTGAVWLLLVLAPPVSFFRWPIRLLPYLYITILVAWAVVMSLALARDHRQARWLAMFTLVGFGAWIGFGERPVGVPWQLGAALITAALCVCSCGCCRTGRAAWRCSRSQRRSWCWLCSCSASPATRTSPITTSQPTPASCSPNMKVRAGRCRSRPSRALTVGLFGRAVRIDAERRRTGEPERLQRHRFRGHGQRTVHALQRSDVSGPGEHGVRSRGGQRPFDGRLPRPAAGRGGEMDGAGPADSRRLATGSARRLRQRVGTRANGARRARNGERHGSRRDITSTGPDARGAERIEFVKDQPARWDHARTTELARHVPAPRSTAGLLHSETAPVDSSRWSCPLAPPRHPRRELVCAGCADQRRRGRRGHRLDDRPAGPAASARTGRGRTPRAARRGPGRRSCSVVRGWRTPVSPTVGVETE